MVHAFNPSAWEAEAGGTLSSRPAWSIELVQDSQYYTEKACLKNKTSNQNKTKITTKQTETPYDNNSNQNQTKPTLKVW